MDWIRFSIERLFGLLATFITGSSVLLLFILHRSKALLLLWNTEVLNYQTKLGIVILCTFAAGFSIQEALTRVGGAIGGGVRGYLDARKKPVTSDQPQPWRDPVWRAVVKTYLGDSTPKDVPYIYQQVVDMKLAGVKVGEPGEARFPKVAEVFREKAEADAADYEWSTWWRQFHLPALVRAHSPSANMVASVSGNLHSASLVLLIAMPWTPALRHWWIVAFCLYWLVNLVIQVIYLGRSGRDMWSSYYDQLEYVQSKKVDAERRLNP